MHVVFSRRVRRPLMPVAAALALLVLLASVALATFSSQTYEGQYQEVDGSTTYTATGVTSGDCCADLLKIDTRAGNDNTGWHWVSQQYYSCWAPGTCSTPAMNMDSSSNFPSSRYGTSLSEAWLSGTQQWGAYSSTSGSSRACFAAWATAGGTC